MSRSLETRLSRVEQILGTRNDDRCPVCSRRGPLAVVRLVDDAGRSRQVCSGCGVERPGEFKMVCTVNERVWNAI